MSPTTKLLSLIFLMVSACSNDEDTNKKLREEIELKDRQKNNLQSNVQQKDERLKAQIAELETLRLSGGPEAVAQATAERDSAIAEKAALENAIAAKDLELKDSFQKLEVARSTQVEMQKSTESLSLDIKAKTDEIAKLAEQIKNLGPEADAAEGLRTQLDSAKKDLANLQSAVKTKEDELTKAKLALKVEIDAKLAEIGALNNRINELVGASANVSALSEALVKLEGAKKDLADLQLAKNKTDLELASSKKTLNSIMNPVFGMYYSEGPGFSFDDKSCRQFVYVEANGRATQAVLCDDNRVQWETRDVSEFAAVVDRDLIGQIGMQMKTTVAENSCGSAQSMFVSSSTYTFEKYLSAQETSGSGTLVLQFNGQPMTLASAAEKLYTEDCEGLLKFAENDTVLDAAMLPLLKQTAQMCNLVAGKASEASLDVGCFTAPNIFKK